MNFMWHYIFTRRSPSSPNLPRAPAGLRARGLCGLCGPYGPRGPTIDLQSFHSFSFHPFHTIVCEIQQLGRFSSGVWRFYIGILATRRGPRACDLCNATRHARATQKVRGMRIQNISGLFCPSWSHLLSSPLWSHFPFMAFSAQRIQSERKTNYIRETGSGLRRFFIGYLKDPTRNSTRLNITSFAEWLRAYATL